MDVYLVNGTFLKFSKKSVIPKEMINKDLDTVFESVTYYTITKVRACLTNKTFKSKNPDVKSYPYLDIYYFDPETAMYDIYRWEGDKEQIDEIVDALENGKTIKLVSSEKECKVVSFNKGL